MMIEINLLPAELKQKNKEAVGNSPQVVYLLLLVFVLLLIFNLILGLVILGKGIEKGIFYSKWDKLKKERAEVEKFKEKYESIAQENKFIQQVFSEGINWAQKLNQISLDIPSSIWIVSLGYKGKKLILEGSAVSLQNDEVGEINNFLNNLKNDRNFIKEFKNIELGPIRRRSIKNYEVVDFTFIAEAK